MTLASCGGDKSSESYTTLSEETLVVIVDEGGNLLDFVPVEEGLESIIIHCPEDGSMAFVYVIGPDVSAEIDGVTMGSHVGEMAMGLVEVDILSGVVVNLMGNLMQWWRFDAKDVLPEIARLKEQEDRSHPLDIEFVHVDRYKQKLVRDDEGNLVPMEMPERAREFLGEIIPALRVGDFKVIDSHYYDRLGYYPRVEEMLIPEVIGPNFRYEFMQVDPDHPDNQGWLEAAGDFPLIWKLTLFGTSGGAMTCADVYGVIEKDGRLMLIK